MAEANFGKNNKEIGSYSTMEDFLTPEQLAKKLSVSRVFLYKLCEQGRIPFFRVGGKKVIRFSPSAIQKWLEETQGQEYHRDKN